MAGDRIIRTCSRLILAAALIGGIGVRAEAANAAETDPLTAYARARVADAAGEPRAAAQDYAVALSGAPDDPAVAARAYRGALAAGDMALAARAGRVLTAAKNPPPDLALVRLARALSVGDAAGAQAATDALANGPLDFLAPSVRAWLARDVRGRDPIAVLDSASVDGTGRRFVAESRALLLIASGERRAGISAVQALLGAERDTLDLRLAAATLLACSRAKDEAAALLASDAPTLAAFRAPRRRCSRADARFGIRWLFTRAAAELNARETAPLVIALTRSALLLDDTNARARIVLAEALWRSRANVAALATLDALPRGSLVAGSADVLRGIILNGMERVDDAVGVATALSAAPLAGAEDAQRLGELLFERERYAEAADAFATAATRRPGGADWMLLLQRGNALERAERWSEARPLLEQAVAMAPDEASALNALGYSLAERGEQLASARTLLERAATLRPRDPSITDSLGWAYFRLGLVAKALPLLERAARARPNSADINEHLGDAYWSLGRRFEARYAWRAAALAAPAADRDRIAGKLETGLH